jgi:hypothetical protein
LVESNGYFRESETFAHQLTSTNTFLRYSRIPRMGYPVFPSD